MKKLIYLFGICLQLFVGACAARAQLVSATNASTQYLIVNGRRIAYRSLGDGLPIVLCNRFRGNLDTWDPLFLDDLARHYRVIIFDYTGAGVSTGTPAADIGSYADDVRDLMTGLHLNKIVIGGWSMGGLVAQDFMTRYPEFVSSALLIDTGPAGTNPFGPEKAFFERAFKPENDLADEKELFYYPESPKSMKAAEASRARIETRKSGLDSGVAKTTWIKQSQAIQGFAKDPDSVRSKLGKTGISTIILSGDHDVAFPVGNWFPLIGQLPNIQLIILPLAGHGSEFQYPALSVKYIQAFLENSLDLSTGKRAADASKYSSTSLPDSSGTRLTVGP
jgi:pimeloyl-ACP methyl ester carboxylesterase